jgi:hypothetical protein
MSRACGNVLYGRFRHKRGRHADVRPILKAHSFPCHGEDSTATALSLMFMNHAVLLRQSEIFAERVMNEAGSAPDDQIVRALRLALAPEPTTEQVERVMSFLVLHMLHLTVVLERSAYFWTAKLSSTKQRSCPFSRETRILPEESTATPPLTATDGSFSTQRSVPSFTLIAARKLSSGFSSG